MVVGDQRRGFRGDLFLPGSVPCHRARRRRPGIRTRRIAPQKFASGGHGSAQKGYGAALIDDNTPTPSHAAFRWPRFALVLAAFLGIWALALGALVALFGWESTFAQMGWFFTKAALLTFGGAYAVLPYVYQGAVDHYGWLTAPQMIDGLALGETTPGPLIMVVAFVGFVGAWTKAALASGALALAGCLGATVATFFTFLPSFLFILLGARWWSRRTVTFASPRR